MCWQDNIVRVYSIATDEILLELQNDTSVKNCYLDQHNRIWIIESAGEYPYTAHCSIIDMYTKKIICKFNIGLHLLSISMIKLSTLYLCIIINSIITITLKSYNLLCY